MAAKEYNYLRCPCCGHQVQRKQLVRGALGHSLQALTQRYVGRPYGTNGGAVIWSRRSMNREELELSGRAVATASVQIVDRLDEDLPIVEKPEAVLSAIDDSNELLEIANDWIREAEEETARRREIVENELQRRRGARRSHDV